MSYQNPQGNNEIINGKNLWERIMPFESANHNIVVVKYRFPYAHCIVSYD